MASLDLTDAYCAVSIHPSSQKYLKFLVGTYSKNAYIRTYNFEMSLFWFLFDETLLGTRVQVLNTGHKKCQKENS